MQREPTRLTRPATAGKKSKTQRAGRFLKNNALTFSLILVFLIGLSLLLYPTVSDYWNSLHQTKAIQSYEEAVAAYSEEELAAVWDAAVAYNDNLHSKGTWSIELKEDEVENYESQLNMDGDGMMGYIEIPKISVYLPIYHGTSDAILARNIGHLEGTSLPVGGEGTHCVLSGHRGLTSARLFTDLDQLVVGDTFLLHVLDQTLTYEVDQVLIVLPEELSALAPVAGEDYCTLVTCTPYGVNSHRMLVRGHRVENAAPSVRITADAVQVDPMLVAPAVAAAVLALLAAGLLIKTRKKGAGTPPTEGEMHGDKIEEDGNGWDEEEKPGRSRKRKATLFGGKSRGQKSRGKHLR